MTTMTTRAQELVAAFEMANETLIVAIEGCTDEQLRTVCNGEGWPVVVTAHHVALAYQPIAGLAVSIATGQELPPYTPEMLDEANAKHAQDHATVSREETVALLRREARAAADSVRGLTDEQLARTAVVTLAGGGTFSAEQMLEGGLIGHPTGHGQSIQAALEAQVAVA
jgi:hypothetical protein